MIWRVITFTAVGLIAGAAGLAIADRTPPNTTVSTKVLNSVVAPGEFVKVQYKIIRHRSCGIHADRWLYDSEGVRATLEDFTSASAPGPIGEQTFVVEVPIPRMMARGPARYLVSSMFYCNPLHRIWPIAGTPTEVHFTIRGPAVLQPDIPIEFQNRPVPP